MFSVLCGSIDWASKIFYCFFCHFWAQNQFECVPDVVCKGLLCVQFSLKFWVVYLCSSLLQLTVESRDLSQAEKKITVVTSWANSPNDNAFQSKLLFFHPEPFWLISVVIWWICSACNNSKKISLINPVIQQSTKVNQNTCRPPCCLSLYCKQLYWGARNSFLKQLLKISWKPSIFTVYGYKSLRRFLANYIIEAWMQLVLRDMKCLASL